MAGRPAVNIEYILFNEPYDKIEERNNLLESEELSELCSRSRPS